MGCYKQINKQKTSLGEDVGKLEPSYVAGGDANDSVAVENGLAVPQKAQHIITI